MFVAPKRLGNQREFNMTETQAVPDEPPTEQKTLFDQAEGVDWLLAYVVGLAERGCSMGITVTSGGMMLTGNVISGRQYFELLGASFKGANTQGAVDLREVLSSSFDGFKDIYPSSDALPEDYVAQPSFLHLKDAKFLAGSSISRGGALWRIKLADVSGFTLGTMQNS